MFFPFHQTLKNKTFHSFEFFLPRWVLATHAVKASRLEHIAKEGSISSALLNFLPFSKNFFTERVIKHWDKLPRDDEPVVLKLSQLPR